MENPLIRCLRDAPPSWTALRQAEEVAEMHVGIQNPHTSLDLIHTLQTPPKIGGRLPGPPP